MDRRFPVPPGGQHSDNSNNDPAQYRRARAYSQPLASPPIPGPSSQRSPEPFDFLNSHPQVGQSNAPSSFPPLGPEFEDDPILRSILAEANQASFHAQLHSLSSLPPGFEHMPPPSASSMHQLSNHPQMATNPLLSQTFMAWLQYMQLQAQLQQQGGQISGQQNDPSRQLQPPNIPASLSHPHSVSQSHSPSSPQIPFPMMPQGPSGPYHQAPQESPRTQGGGLPMSTPSPEADNIDPDSQIITEEKRRRNTAASARFRVKKKQWTLNLERSITDLSGRVEELEREASELRRENGWLKEIVMLKSKRFGTAAPDVDLTPPEDREDSTTPQNPDAPGEEAGRAKESDESAGSPGKGKQVQR
ncbi:hypothetical protein BDY19DRAFT_996556 [Irpex rosettiformis]|uniref:Uncharacterized protein n=1 Tax=Irpex rosettiformis TaxID=378272 RepID=A0ACB8TUE7_9APHY|nr:hypothetical protein BDY19DRAFT_996556 [Irpex rosettiformis]